MFWFTRCIRLSSFSANATDPMITDEMSPSPITPSLIKLLGQLRPLICKLRDLYSAPVATCGCQKMKDFANQKLLLFSWWKWQPATLKMSRKNIPKNSFQIGVASFESWSAPPVVASGSIVLWAEHCLAQAPPLPRRWMNSNSTLAFKHQGGTMSVTLETLRLKVCSFELQLNMPCKWSLKWNYATQMSCWFHRIEEPHIHQLWTKPKD